MGSFKTGLLTMGKAVSRIGGNFSGGICCNFNSFDTNLFRTPQQIKMLCVAVALAFLFLPAAAVFAETPVSGTISVNTTWTLSGSPYVVTGDVNFSNSAHLTIEPGVKIKFEPSTAIIVGYGYKGSLSAVGTEASPIVFTSNLASPVRGSWKGIYFDSETNDLKTVLEYCVVEYAGQDYKASIMCEDSYPAIRNCTVRYSANYPIRVEPEKVNLSGNIYENNKYQGTLIEGGTIYADTTWGNKGDESTYIVTGDVQFSDSAHLTIEPGVRIRFEPHTAIILGYGYKGSLSAIGTEASPIVFTSNLASPVPGSWKGIYFDSETNDLTTVLEYCIVEYAGQDYKASIMCESSYPAIRNCTVRYSGTYPIRVEPQKMNLSGNTYTDNKKDGTLIEGGTIAADTTWGNKGDESKYIVIEDVTFSDSAHLTIEPGAEIRFESNTGILVGYGYNGSLSAVGTETSPIVFTSNLTSPVPGSWKGIYFYTNTLDAKSILEYCIVEYAGRNIYFDDASPTIRRNIIKNASDSGIYIQYSGSNSAVIDCNNISDNKYGIYLNSATPQIVNNNFVNNQTGLHNNSSGAVNAKNNWWNNAGGPGANSSNGVYGNVSYDPWLTGQSDCVSSPGTETGYLQVTITPADAVTAGAKWCVKNTCYDSGATAELSAGTYTVEFKAVTGYIRPANQSATVRTGQTATAAGTYTKAQVISGYVRDSAGAGISGVMLILSNGGGTVTTDSSGYYSISVRSGWSGEVMPSLSGYTFTPSSQSFSSLSSDQTLNFTGTRAATSFTVSGSVRDINSTGVSGVTLTFGNSGGTVTTDASGFYSNTVTSGWSGTVTPSGSDCTFTPANRTFGAVTSNQFQNFTAACSGVSPAWIIRILPGTYIPGVKFTVTLKAAPPSGTVMYSVEDKCMNGWTVDVADISDGGTFDTNTGKVKFTFQDGEARTLTYTVAPPSDATGDGTFAGTGIINASARVIGGQSVISQGSQTHPADTDANFTMDIVEMNSYGSAWLHFAPWTLPPNPIPMSYVSKAVELWLNGETYKFDSASGSPPQCWVNSASTRSLREDVSLTAVRTLPCPYTAGTAITVTISVSASAGGYTVEETPPAGWTVSDVSDGGKAEGGLVRFWIPIAGGQAKTLTYKATPPADAKGAYTFGGEISYDGKNETITGDISVSDTQPGDVNGDTKADLKDAIIALQIVVATQPPPTAAVGADVNND
ncbi:MAG: hypothetical protein BWK80_47170, partial [Desulfobacteraceae bacterium IS3]